MSVRVRIAPSPTGNLHIGTARTALFNWLFARHHGGKFLLRIEDTDTERSQPEYVQNILSGLQWLGLHWDEGPFFQTQRLHLYQQGIQKLLDKGLAYRSYETPEELEQLREEQKAKGLPPRYDNRHRNLTPAEEAKFIAEGRQPVIRFKIDDDREIRWQDMVRGEVIWQGKDLGGDMVIARASGQPLYNFVVVMDDIDMGITHVIRGEDHIGNTPKQILLYEALGAPIPQFGHTPLILNQQGAKLSKRDGATSVDEYRAMGYLPEAFNNYMLLLGWSPPDARELYTLEEAIPVFDFDRINKAGARFDLDKLNWINSQYLHQKPTQDLLPLVMPFWRQAGYEVDQERDNTWLLGILDLIKPSMTVLKDAVGLAEYFFIDQPEYKPEAKEVLQQEQTKTILQKAKEMLEASPTLDAGKAKEAIDQLVKDLGVKKGVVMKPLRCALTGDVHGPDLIISLTLLHQKQKAVPRLQYAIKLA
ncbi:MAG: glutamate--tRNA ligase [Pseudanabaenaceae cyanobacterium SKYGB_i_bin29]|nr:glutamate--tRNA ligase [Pseudanabaenaceae cyanobacterium SKYG29]MDW8420798.1 glutamate--tRNA ligase [Pseudanabaenaceae cyanobacterium SKYGB_i_bin29]